MTVGGHGTDVRLRNEMIVGVERSNKWPPPDLSSNAFQTSAIALATLYDPDDTGVSSPTISNSEDARAAEALAPIIEATGLWPAMQRIQADTLALNEMLVRLDTVAEDDGTIGLMFRPVYPDLVEVKPNPRNPSKAIEIREWCWREEHQCWTREVWSIDGTPRHHILDEAGEDVSDKYGLPPGGLSGDLYPALRSDGRGILPYGWHHRALGTGALWDPYTGIEVVEGTLQCCLHWTQYAHILANAAHKQRYTIGAEFGGSTTGPDGVTSVVGDPAVILNLRAQADFDGQPQAGAFDEPTDPAKVAESIISYERRLHSRAGLDPSDVQRISGDPRSGYALEISSKSKEQSAMKFAPVFARGDAEVVTIAAVLINRAIGAPLLPEKGWSVEHAITKMIKARAIPPQPLVGLAQTVTQIAVAVSAGQMPRDAGVAQVAHVYGIPIEQADALIGSAGRGFIPRITS